ncbi:MAG: hypothetical protein U7M05_06320 [Candidatus Igneacidithiobacillus chanchocoensis]
MWEETGNSDTRLFLEPMIPNKFVLVWRSTGGHYNEHVVPRVLLCQICHEILAIDSSGKSLKRISEIIKKHLKVVQITKEEQQKLDREFKVSMPPGWDYESGDTFARLKEVGIEFTLLPSETY